LHTDQPGLLFLPQAHYTIPALGQVAIRLLFELPPYGGTPYASRGPSQQSHDQLKMQLPSDSLPPTSSVSQIRLWIHNELAEQNEEGLVFMVRYLTAFETTLLRLENVQDTG
jgi:hypothetical protein